MADQYVKTLHMTFYGTGDIGTTTFLRTFIDGKYGENAFGIVEEQKEFSVGGTQYKLQLKELGDEAGLASKDFLGVIVLLCSLKSQESFETLRDEVVQLIDTFAVAGDVQKKVFFLGLQNEDDRVITDNQLKDVASDAGFANQWAAVSAKKEGKEGVEKVFQQILKKLDNPALEPQKKEEKDDDDSEGGGKNKTPGAKPGCGCVIS